MKKRLLSALLALCMMLTMMPAVAFAADGDGSSSDVSDVHVEMDNLLLKTNQAGRLSYVLPEGIDESEITFAAAPESTDDVDVYQSTSNGIWYARYQTQAVKTGTTGTINAIYNDQVVGSCTFMFVSPFPSVAVTYSTESAPFAVPTEITATATINSLGDMGGSGEPAATGWRWVCDSDPAIASVVPTESKSNTAVITYYQDDYAKYTAMPLITIDGTEYAYVYLSSQSKRPTGDSITASNDNIWQNTEITLTFNLPESLQETANVTWSSDNESVIPSPTETAAAVRVKPPLSGHIEGGNTSVTLTATAEIDGHVYSGSVSILVWKVVNEADQTVDTWDELVAAVEALQDAESPIIDIAGTIAIPKNGSLDISGITLRRADSVNGAMFSVTVPGAEISSDGSGVIDGDYSGNGPMIEVTSGGQLAVSNITMQNAGRNSTGGDDGSQGGAISAQGGKLVCTGVKFMNNTATGNSVGENLFNGGGAIYSANAEIDITDCEFTGNKAVFGNGGAIYADNNTTGIIADNEISGSEAQQTGDDTDGFGGAIYCRLAGELTISGNTIESCEAGNDGGGIAILTTGDSGKITLAANTISNNTSNERGGGLYLVQEAPDTIDLQSGVISGNHADWGGGIDYTVHSQETLVLTNVLITGNEAVRGAGIWACPTSETETSSTLGGAIYGNIATGDTYGVELNPIYASGDDIRYEGKDADKHGEDRLILQGDPWFTDSTEITVMERALGGGAMQWYQDEQNDRYQEGNAEADPSLYTNTSSSFSLHGELSAEHQELAAAEAKLIIKDNVAESRGGGIATNSPIQIGMKDADITVKVEKTWEADGHDLPDSVQVDLYRINEDTTERVLLDTAILTADMDWKTEFTDLPAYYLNDNGDQKNYAYDVEERPVSNWQATESAPIISEDGKTISFTLTNTYVPDIVSIKPVDLTIYMGGDDGYEAVVGDENSGVVSDTNNSLPKPIFEITATDAASDFDNMRLTTADGTRAWVAERIDTIDGQPSNYYALEAALTGQDPVRVTYTGEDGKPHLSDSFDIADAKDLFETYEVALYTNQVDVSGITATVGSKEYLVNADKTGTLTVRTVVNTEGNDAVSPVVNEAPAEKLIAGSGVIVADSDTKYTVNNLDIPVPEGAAPSLLFDTIVTSDGTDRESALEDKVAEQVTTANNRTRRYQSQYLDLVDANNGNIWLKANKAITVYWAYPTGTDASDDFSLWHFEGLHRDDSSGGSSGFDIGDLDAATTKLTEVDIEKGEYGISFTVLPGGFSPFVLTWTESSGGGSTSGGGGNNKPDDLNTEDHFAYIIGYPKDYRTGEPTDDESLWPVEPQGDITRAEVATIFFRMLTDEARDRNWSQTNDYTDVASTDWYNNAISTLSNMGIISGDPSGAFRPDDSITRAEFTKIAVGFFDKAGDYVDGTYDDVSSSDWYADFIDAAVDLGLIEGYPDGTIRPEATITRAEACTIVNRTLGRVPDKDHLLPADEMRVWPDNSDTNEWYYAQIQEATNSHDYEWIGEENDQIENWTEKLEDRDWAQLEREWSDANSAPGGEVVD
ncbi:S-layer homology domain-containing protein [Agathobaculum sp.]|uniref:S-layer homology domain-containing protein n=1 Tax=Agathobaculum sp. TaxID=2048138 RepID=UPI0039A0E2C9